MIPYEQLCQALDRYNARRRGEVEMEQLDQIHEAAPAPDPAEDPVTEANYPAPSGLEMGATDQVFVPGEDGVVADMGPMLEQATATTAENEVPFLDQPTDATGEPEPSAVDAAQEETTQEFDIEEAEEIEDKDLGPS